MIEVICNDRLGKKIRVKCNEDDTIGDLKKLLAAQIGACAPTSPLLTPATHDHALPFVPAHQRARGRVEGGGGGVAAPCSARGWLLDCHSTSALD
jgi:hypothetical protein